MTNSTPDFLRNQGVRRTDLVWSDWPAISAFLKDELICRIAVNDGEVPYIAAQSFTFTGTEFLLHSSRFGRLASILSKEPLVMLEIDRPVALLKAPKGQNTSLEYYSVIAKCRTNFRHVVDEVVEHQLRALGKFRPENGFLPLENGAAEQIVAYRCEIVEMSAKKRILADGQYSPPGQPKAPYVRFPFATGAAISGLTADAFDGTRFTASTRP